MEQYFEYLAKHPYRNQIGPKLKEYLKGRLADAEAYRPYPTWISYIPQIEATGQI